MKRLSVAVLIALILAASVSAYAQAPAPVAAAAVDPAALAAAKEMVAAMKMREVMAASMKQATQSIPQMIDQMTAGMIKADTRLSDAQKKEVLDKMQVKRPEITAAMQSLFEDPKMIDEMVDEIAPLYARNFTVAEINAIAVFYKSDAGAKTLRVMPQLMNESMMTSQKVLMPRLTKMMEKFAATVVK
jgi:hypothetical protein